MGKRSSPHLKIGANATNRYTYLQRTETEHSFQMIVLMKSMKKDCIPSNDMLELLIPKILIQTSMILVNL